MNRPDILRFSACIAGIIRLYYAQAIDSADSTCKHFDEHCIKSLPLTRIKIMTLAAS